MFDFTFEKLGRNRYAIGSIVTLIGSRFTIPLTYYIIDNGMNRGGETKKNVELCIKFFNQLYDSD